MSARHPFAYAVTALALIVLNLGARAADPTKTVVVDCAAGETIAKALTLGDERKPLLVQIVGTCSEHVLIDRNDVTLAAGASGATVSGPDINSQVRQNGRMGIGVFTNGSARIGVDNANNAAGNVISANASNGIHIVFGSGALIAMNQITGNGTSADPAALKIGINLAS